MYISKTIITCKNCGEKYYLIEESYPMREKDKLPCEKCGFIGGRSRKIKKIYEYHCAKCGGALRLKQNW